MADWTWTPQYPYVIEYEGPTTLVSRFEDGTEIRRVKWTSSLRTFRGKFYNTDAQMDSQLDFFDLKGLGTAFTVTTYAPNEGAGTTATVVIAEPPRISAPTNGYWEVEWVFRQVR